MKNLMSLFILIFIITQGCSNQPKIVITQEYIVNKYWNEYNGNILIERLKLKKDSVLDIFQPSFNLNEPNHWNIVRKLEIDSAFRYAYNTGLKYDYLKSPHFLLDKKLYFNKNNGNYWCFNEFGNEYKKRIGSLENSTWYRFSNLRERTKFYLYVYVDSTGKVTKFIHDLSNY